MYKLSSTGIEIEIRYQMISKEFEIEETRVAVGSGCALACGLARLITMHVHRTPCCFLDHKRGTYAHKGRRVLL